jgi:integrase
VQYRANGTQRREILGDIRRVTLEMARKAARQRFAQLELGIDPGAAKKAARDAKAAVQLTLANVSERYLDAKQAIMRPGTYQDAARHFTQHWALLRNRPIAQITRAEIAAGLQDISKTRGPVAAARARANLSALFGWAIREGLCGDANPVAVTNDPSAGRPARDRVLAMAELAIIWKACGDDDFGRIIKLLALTGCRRSEIGGLKWDEIDFDRGTLTISAARAKNGRSLTLTLPRMAIDLLRAVSRREGQEVFGSGADGFTSWSDETAALNDRIVAAEGKSLPPWTLHDIRRSVATHLADDEIGIQPHIIEALLNHVSGHKRGVAGIYNRARYDREIASALRVWSEHLIAAVENRESKIVPMKRA